MLAQLFFGLFAIGVGAAIAFRGLTMFKVLLPFWAFFVGMWAGLAGMAALFGGGLFSSLLGIAIGFFIGLAFAAVSYFAYGLAVVIFGASIGFALGQGFMALFGLEGGLIAFLVGAVLAIGMALLFMMARMPRLIVIVATASAGAMALISGIFAMFGVFAIGMINMGATRVAVRNSALWTFVWLAIAVAGVMAQYANEKKKEALMKDFIAMDVMSE